MITRSRGCRAARSLRNPLNTRRPLSVSALERRLCEPVQSYISTSRDPCLNLSIEHHLLQKSSPDSVILFLFVNRPSIIIGRNQNPWLEVNLALLQRSGKPPETGPPSLGAIDLVRRRSGGGTVFHDEGNVNWTVICPSAKFTRDKHAEMVVRALRERGIQRARVNERHDIVLDQGDCAVEYDLDPQDTHITAYTDESAPRPLKVSGSAYKLTRGRALHHGTCLLNSPNLHIIPQYLHSPAKPYIRARGVESVSSPVGNISLTNDDFINAVQTRFQTFYHPHRGVRVDEVDEALLQTDNVSKGYDEIKSQDWTYLQTPQFSISTVADKASAADLELVVRNGAVTAGSISLRNAPGSPKQTLGSLKGRKLHQISSWEAAFRPDLNSLASQSSQDIVKWFQRMLPEAAT